MRRINLIVKSGEHVAVVEIAPFPDEALPDVVGWGCRVFQRDASKLVNGLAVYVEAFAVVSLTPSPGLSQ